MNTSTARLPEMINSSIAVLTRPSVGTFEEYEKRGTMRDGLIYVGVAAAIAGVAGMLFGLITGGIEGAIFGLIAGVVGPLVGYLIFSFLLFFIGRSQGGTGTQDEVFYSTSLYVAPLQGIIGVVSAIPLLNCLLLPVTFLLGLYQIYLAYLATRASMNLDQTKGIITVVIAYVVQFVIGLLIAGILAAIGIGAAAAGQ